jgi:hypothetical protein
MKHYLWLYVFLFIFTLPLTAQNIDTFESTLTEAPKEYHESAFKSGEWLKFRIHYGFFNASYATLALSETKRNNELLYFAQGIGRTTGIARWFFKVDDYYDSYFTKENTQPIHFIRNINEGGYKKNVTIDFDHQNNQARSKDLIRQSESYYKTNSNVQDLVSCFYFLRNQVKNDSLELGEFIVVNLFFDSDNYAFRFKYLGKEKIKTKFGYVNTLKFRPYVQTGRIFKNNESIMLWVSEDNNKIPVRLRADLRIGSITVDLDEFKGLKHPFEIVID